MKLLKFVKPLRLHYVGKNQSSGGDSLSGEMIITKKVLDEYQMHAIKFCLCALSKRFLQSKHNIEVTWACYFCPE